MDFPFLKRYSRAQLARHPERRGRDRATMRRSCTKFSRLPLALMNFVEGTRFTPAKHAAQQSPYQHLLRPRAGGLAFTLDTMGDMLHAMLDVTIVYVDGPYNFLDLLADQIRTVRLHVRELPIDMALRGDYEHDEAFRERFYAWLNELWQAKDARITHMLEATPASGDTRVSREI